MKEQSLDDLTGILQDDYNVEISNEALNKRFNNYATKFLANALEKLLQQQLEFSAIEILQNKFNRVLIKDSVCFQIHESMVEYYPGSGGNGSNAAIRIQFEYDVLNGLITDISINAFNKQDAKDSKETIEITNEGDLIIRDLAYMSIDVLNKIILKNAFYLCRPNTQVTMYELKNNDYAKIDFKKITRYMKKNQIQYMEKEIYYGAKDKIKTRLIIHLIPENEYEKRIRNAKKNNKKDGGDGNLTAEYKARSALNLFITNTEPEQIQTENVWSIYRLRWQIELMFKIWKSICKIDKVKNVKVQRLDCYLYSRIIFIVLAWKMIWIVAKNLFGILGKTLSFYKAYKTLLKRKLQLFKDALITTDENYYQFIIDFFDYSLTKHLLDKRKDHLSSIDVKLTCFDLKLQTSK